MDKVASRVTHEIGAVRGADICVGSVCVISDISVTLDLRRERTLHYGPLTKFFCEDPAFLQGTEEGLARVGVDK